MKRLLLLIALLWAVPASATTRYISTTGNDSNTCAQSVSISTPRRTVVAGVACLNAGDELLIRGGTYDSGLINLPSGTSWSNFVRIAAYTGEVVNLIPTAGPRIDNDERVVSISSASYVEIDGINIDSAHMGSTAVYIMASAHHIRMQNLDVSQGVLGGSAAILVESDNNELYNISVHGGGIDGVFCGTPCSSYGFYIAGRDNIIDGANIYNTSGLGLQFYAASRTVDNNIFRNSRIHDIVRSGFAGNEVDGMLVNGTNARVYNNVFYNIGQGTAGGACLVVYGGGSSGNKIYNNTCYNIEGNGISATDSSSPAQSSDFKNNLVITLTGTPFTAAAGTTYTCTNLVTTGATTNCTSGSHGSVTAGAVFVSAGGGDFRLAPGSPAIDVGADVSATFTTDYAGTTRGASFDVGAYEFVVIVPVLPVPRATGSRVITETFTDSDSTNITSHTGEKGATWVRQTGSGGSLVVDSNRIRGNTANETNIHLASGIASTPDVDVECDMRVFTLIVNHFPSILARFSATLQTGYAAQYNVESSQWEIFYWANGATGLLAAYPATLTPGSTYHVVLILRGSLLTLEVDGVQIVQVVDTMNTGSGRSGINIYNDSTADTSSTGIHIDNFFVTQIKSKSNMLLFGVSE